MKERILDLLSQEDYYGMTIDEIASKFNYDDAQQFKELVKTMVSLEEKGIVTRGIKDCFFLSSREVVVVGKVQLHARGFGFVNIGEDIDDVYVGERSLMGALDRDVVKIKIIKKQSGSSIEGEVIEILERGLTQVVGLVRLIRGKFCLLVDDKKYNDIIILEGNRKGAMEGHKVVVKITSYEKPLKGEVINVLGHKNDPGVDILSIIAKHDLPIEFGEEVINEVDQIGDEVAAEDLVGRVDLRDEIIVTIDGDDAKDLDDAISIKKLRNGNYELGVHIADVSNYVKEGTELDKEAIKRGTSVYLVDRVIPMLPHKLSNGVCSLNPHVDRLTISCIMEINSDGDVVEHKIVPSVIHSTERMTYNNVNKILDGDNALIKKYEHIYKKFFIMEQLAIILKTKRNKKGTIDFDVNEAKIVVNKKGKPIDIILRNRGISEKIIEEFMLLANETIAEHFHWMEVPFIYRVHETPKKKKLLNFATIASVLGYKIKGSLDNIYPNDLSSLIESSKGKPEHSVISTLLLRCMQKARYDDKCLGHFGLADEYYTHFTSPIRRYPDLLVHRLIRKYLFDNDLSEDTIAHYQQLVPVLAESSSNREIDAVNCERDVMDMKKAEYMMAHIGETFTGIISSITSFGFFVELPNTIDGLVHISTLLDDYYSFDQKYLMLVGERTGKQYKMSDQVKVKLVSASKIDGQIDFEIVSSKPNKKKKKPDSTNGKKVYFRKDKKKTIKPLTPPPYPKKGKKKVNRRG